MAKTRKLPEGTIPLDERRSLAAEWTAYAEQVIPEHAPLVQRIESRRAFYAGAQALLGLISGGLDADHEPTALDVAYLDALNHELTAFGRAVGGGRA